MQTQSQTLNFERSVFVKISFINIIFFQQTFSPSVYTTQTISFVKYFYFFFYWKNTQLNQFMQVKFRKGGIGVKFCRTKNSYLAALLCNTPKILEYVFLLLPLHCKNTRHIQYNNKSFYLCRLKFYKKYLSAHLLMVLCTISLIYVLVYL